MFRIPRNLYYRFGGAKPRVDDPVWWTSKQVWGVVTKVESDGSFVFQCGPVVETRTGRQVPRWTVATHVEDAKWTGKMWVVGNGPNPVGRVVNPEPMRADVIRS